MDYCVEYDYVTEEEVEADDGTIHYHYSAGPAIADVFGQPDHADLREAARGVFGEYPSDDLKALAVGFSTLSACLRKNRDRALLRRRPSGPRSRSRLGRARR